MQFLFFDILSEKAACGTPVVLNWYQSACFGISWSPSKTDFEHAYARADAALYRAKQQGRNQVVSAANPDQSIAPHS
tara:strand:- start:59 stop:289 length:231 start_codon:yes stop_codon:yes gene_type:complete